MTRKDMVNWLENQKSKTIIEKDTEMCRRRDAVLEDALRPLGFYEMAGEVEALVRQAWDTWIKWKAANESSTLSATTYNYLGFESRIKYLTELGSSMAEHMLKHDIALNTDAMDELNKEERTTRDKIRSTYDSVIHAVYAAKNIREATAYLEGLGFDLSELENPPALTAQASEIDASYLFLNKAA